MVVGNLIVDTRDTKTLTVKNVGTTLTVTWVNDGEPFVDLRVDNRALMFAQDVFDLEEAVTYVAEQLRKEQCA